MRLGGSMLLRLYFGEYTLPYLDLLFETIDAAVADPDLVVAHPAASLWVSMACERRGVPWIVGDLFPMLLPSERTPRSGTREAARPWLASHVEPGDRRPDTNAVPDQSQGIWPFASLAPLLPRCRAIVHSGAHGTNALALAAGVPSAIMPCLFDQLWHARRQEQLGTGIHVRDTAHLEASIRALLGDQSIRDRACGMGASIGAEQGTEVAVDAIEGFLGST